MVEIPTTAPGAPDTPFPELKLPRRLLEMFIARAKQHGHIPASLLRNGIAKYLDTYKELPPYAPPPTRAPRYNHPAATPRISSYDAFF